MDMKCDRCKKQYKHLFDSILRMDYAIPGKGKPYEYHLCIDCRKKLVQWVEKKK